MKRKVCKYCDGWENAKKLFPLRSLLKNEKVKFHSRKVLLK